MQTIQTSTKPAVKSDHISYPSALIEKWIENSRLPWTIAVFLVPLIMIIVFVIAFLLDHGSAQFPSSDLLRATLIYPLYTAYMLFYSQILKRKRDKALVSFRPVALIDDEKYSLLVAKAALFSVKYQRLALIIGALVGLFIGSEWLTSLSWINLYGFVASIVLYCVIGWWIYYTISGTRFFTILQACPLDIDIFDLKLLKPIASWSLSLTIMYALGITLGIVIISNFLLSIVNITVFSIYILAAAFVFFFNLASTHRVIIHAKQKELDVIQNGMKIVSEALKKTAVKRSIEETKKYLDTFTAWQVYEKRIKEVPEWPFTVDIKRNLVLSTILPFIIMILKGLLTKFINQLSSLIP